MELRARVRSALRLKEEMDQRKARERELEALTRKFEQLSNQDGLTGVPNRRCFDGVLHKEWLRCRRAGAPLSALMSTLSKTYSEPDSALRRSTVMVAPSCTLYCLPPAKTIAYIVGDLR